MRRTRMSVTRARARARAALRARRVTRRSFALLIVAALAGLTACSGGSESDSSTASKPRVAEDTGTQSSKKNAPLASDKRAVVYTAHLSMRAKNVNDATGRAVGIARKAEGYVAQQSTTDAHGAHTSARSSLELKVPVDAYQPTVRRLTRKLGTRLSLRQKSQDKTSEVADVDSRVSSAKASLKRLRKIMDKATTVDDIMRVEDAISDRESDLESLQARAKHLDRSTTYSTIDLRIVGPSTPVAEPAEPGFWGGLVAGWHALLDFLRVATLVIGAVLPFAVLAAVIAAPAWWLWRRRRSARTPSPSATDSPPSQ